jgi:hypothetical protein
MKFFPFLINDVTTNIRYKYILKSDIENDNVHQLINHLKEYESYAVSNYKYESVVMLNLYALFHLVNEKIYDDYLISNAFLY